MKRNSAAKRPRSRPTKFENLSSNYATVLYEARDISQPSQRAANSELALDERFPATRILRSKPLTVQFAGGGGESKSYVTVKCGTTCGVDVPPLHARAAAHGVCRRTRRLPPSPRGPTFNGDITNQKGATDQRGTGVRVPLQNGSCRASLVLRKIDCNQKGVVILQITCRAALSCTIFLRKEDEAKSLI